MFQFIIFLLIALVHCQDPRKRMILESNNYNNDDGIACNGATCVKRSSSQDDLGPFWANRGKKDLTFRQERLYADEPHWILIKKDPDSEPFFTSRGKKLFSWKTFKYFHNDDAKSRRDRREYTGDEIDPAFFAARGKKTDEKF